MKYPKDMPVVFSYGGGTNSSAILVKLINRGYPAPKLIIFADTGAEMPHTYKHIEIMTNYAVKNGYPPITIVRNEQASKYGGIYEMCITNRILPGVAYGHKSCSVQFKIEPNNKHTKMVIGKHTQYIKIIGYDFDEQSRANNAKAKETADEFQWFPLIEWQMGRDECVKALADAGLPPAGKSSCFFCPNMRPHEIKKLAQEYPDLMTKAIAVEDAAAERRLDDGKQQGIYGLGRNWRWKDLIATEDMFGFTDLNREAPCGCYDGDE